MPLDADSLVSRAWTGLWRPTLGPLLSGLVGVIAGLIAGGKLVMAAGHGLGHMGAEGSVIVLVVWLTAVVLCAVAAIAAFLILATIYRLVRLVIGKRAWSSSGSIHAGALALFLIVEIAVRAAMRHTAPANEGSRTLYELLIAAIGVAAAGPSMAVGGVLGAWLHRRLRHAPARG